MLALEVAALQHVSEDADRQHNHHEDDEPGADGRLREGVDRTDQAGAGEQRAQQVSRKVEKMSHTFQLFIMPFFSCIITECRKAVPVSQGMKLAFSTGSHPQ